MRERIEQRLMFVLSVQLDESRGEIAKRRGGRERAVDERAAASLAADLAPDDQLAPIGVLEDRFDGRLRFTGADEIGGGARAEQEADGFDEDRLAGPGLPRQYVEARVRTRPRRPR